MLNLTELIGLGVGGGDAHLYWRIITTGDHSNWAAFSEQFALRELELRGVAGGASLCSGGTAIESSHWSSFVAANAFNGNTSDTWYALTGAAGEWIGYSHPAPVSVVEVAIYPYGGAWTTFDLQYADDLSGPWTTLKSFDWAVYTTAGGFRIYS